MAAAVWRGGERRWRVGGAGAGAGRGGTQRARRRERRTEPLRAVERVHSQAGLGRPAAVDSQHGGPLAGHLRIVLVGVLLALARDHRHVVRVPRRPLGEGIDRVQGTRAGRHGNAVGAQVPAPALSQPRPLGRPADALLQQQRDRHGHRRTASDLERARLHRGARSSALGLGRVSKKHVPGFDPVKSKAGGPADGRGPAPHSRLGRARRRWWAPGARVYSLLLKKTALITLRPPLRLLFAPRPDSNASGFSTY